MCGSVFNMRGRVGVDDGVAAEGVEVFAAGGEGDGVHAEGALRGEGVVCGKGGLCERFEDAL